MQLFIKIKIESGLTLVEQTDKKELSRPDLFGRPSLIPGVKYPISEKEEALLDAAWDRVWDMKNRGLL